MNSPTVLSVQDFSILCSLGCTAEERATLQEVRASIEIRFSQTPKACESDSLEDTVCYAALCTKIKEVVDSKSFHTVEHLAQEIYKSLTKIISENNLWRLKIHKVNPPIAGLRGGVFFEIGDPL